MEGFCLIALSLPILFHQATLARFERLIEEVLKVKVLPQLHHFVERKIKKEKMLKFEKAKKENLLDIVNLLIEDDLGSTRESLSDASLQKYKDAFARIDEDKNQFLFLVKKENDIVGTYHLTLMPSMTFEGSSRLNIEAVRVNKDCRGQQIGEQMMEFAINFAKESGCGLVQLASNKLRTDAIRFYEKCGFESSHVGMKVNIK